MATSRARAGRSRSDGANADRLEEYRTEEVLLETALPAKFEDAIVEALGRKPERPAGLENLETLPQRYEVLDIDVDHGADSLQSDVEQVAVLYANGQDSVVRPLLESLVYAYPGVEGIRLWHMLFDLYCIQNRDKEFEQLALDYAMRFETSPPVCPIATRWPLGDAVTIVGAVSKAMVPTSTGLVGSAIDHSETRLSPCAITSVRPSAVTRAS